MAFVGSGHCEPTNVPSGAVGAGGHDRVPVLIAERTSSLDCVRNVALLKPAPNDLLQRWPVSKCVNSVRRAMTILI